MEAGENRSETASDESGTKLYRDVSSLEMLAILTVSFPVYLLFDSRGEAFRGFVAAVSVGVILGLLALLRPLTKKPRFWFVLFMIAIAHTVLVYFLPYTGSFRFGFALAPVAVLDIYLSGKLLMFICRPGVRSAA